MTIIQFKSKYSWFWLSFRNKETNTFLGVSIIQASNFKKAFLLSWSLKINPGGEVLAYNITEDINKIMPKDRHRLLNREEALHYQQLLNQE